MRSDNAGENARRPRQRDGRIVLAWEASDGTRRVVARGQDALRLFHSTPGVVPGPTGARMVLGTDQEDGSFSPMIWQGGVSDDVEVDDDWPGDGPDNSCERLGL